MSDGHTDRWTGSLGVSMLCQRDSSEQVLQQGRRLQKNFEVSLDLLNRTDRRDEFIHRHSEFSKLSNQLLMLVGRQAAVLGHLNVLMTVVHGVGPAIKQIGNGLSLAGCFNTVLRGADLVLLDLEHGHGYLCSQSDSILVPVFLLLQLIGLGVTHVVVSDDDLYAFGYFDVLNDSALDGDLNDLHGLDLPSSINRVSSLAPLKSMIWGSGSLMLGKTITLSLP